MVPYIIDIVIVLVLAFFAWRGAKKGLILTLFGLLGLVVAFWGARFVSNTFYEPVSDIIKPGIYQNVQAIEKKALEDIGLDFDQAPSVGGLIEVLRNQEVFPGLVDLLEDAVEKDGSDNISTSASERLAEYLSDLLARLALFALSFLLILLIWFLVSHILDLAFKLPILSAVNWIGGLLLGLIKAVIIIVILVWVGQRLAWLPAEPDTPVLSLFTPSNIAQWLNRILA